MRVFYTVCAAKPGTAEDFDDVKEAAIAFARAPASSMPHVVRTTVDDEGRQRGAMVGSFSRVSDASGTQCGKWAAESDPAFKEAYDAVRDIPGEKQPWEMTRAEWFAEYGRFAPETVQSNFTKRSGSEAVHASSRREFLRFGVCDDARRRMLAAQRREICLTPDELDEVDQRLRTPVSHEDVVQKAVRMGLPVPDKVLVAYPEQRSERCVA